MVMAKKFKEVLDFLKKQGVEISSDAADAVKKEFGEQMLASENEIVKEGYVVVPQKVYDEKTDDLSKWKERARKAEDRSNDLKAALDAGDSENAKLAEKWKTEFEKMNPLAQKYIEALKSGWTEVAETIPDDLKEFYVFPKEGEELSQADLEKNVLKVAEHRKLGVFEIEEGSGEGKKIPPTGKKQSVKKPGEGDEGKSRTDLMAEGYKTSGDSAAK